MRYLLLFLCFPLAQSFANTAKVAIVIDDIGYRYTDAKVLEIPGDISYSILPHTPYGKRLALKAHNNNKDVFLHIPMEAENGKKLGPGGLTTAMNEMEVNATLQQALAEIPFALGINNHMGSKLTKQYQHMLWTMRFLKRNNLLFLDSKTSVQSQAKKAAIAMDVPVHSRHVFLDNQLNEDYITQQFNVLIKQAHANKLAIAIAHPHPETVSALKKLVPTLKQQNIELVSLSSLYPYNIKEPEKTKESEKSNYLLTAKASQTKE